MRDAAGQQEDGDVLSVCRASAARNHLPIHQPDKTREDQSTMAKIVFASNAGEQQLEALRAEFPGTTFVAAPDVEAQKRELVDADAIISWPHREALPVAKQLTWVHCTSAGIERIRSVPELIEMDQVTLTNARGAHAGTIADHCFAFMLALTRNIPA
jgi:phosphoglycerate dehydrogenase-like enzyme